MHYSNYTITRSILLIVQISLLFVFSTSFAQTSNTGSSAKKTEGHNSTPPVDQNKIKQENSNTKKTLTYEVVFDQNKSSLNLAAKDKLDRIYNVYAKNILDTLNIISKGNKDDLFKERSIAVTNYLISKGVPSSRIRYIDFGNAKVGDGIEVIIK